LIYVAGDFVYCGSVGDSRGIIGTTMMPDVLPAPPANLGAEREILATVKQKRKSIIETQMNSIQLTKDQKPEDPEELQRITAAGGRVQRLTDNAGNKIGPYRVWKKHANSPGLAMSRSIGDMIAKNIGVISEPVCTNYNRVPGDLFIVIGSDGVWDAMDNEDVGTFVEYYRRKCKTNVNSPPLGCDVSFQNTCIAQILCEEARLRWYTIVEEEDVMIDDISCIVLEIRRNDEILARHSKRPVPIEEVPLAPHDEEPQEGLRRAPTLKEIAVRDPRRGSIVEDKITGLEL
jgi:serine/threonine protein phosphatase PrpC